MAGTFDGAMGRTNYVVMTGDANGDGQIDVLMKAVPKIVMIPIDDDLSVPVPVAVPSPTFVLLSGAGGTHTLVASPDAQTLAFAGWQAGAYEVTYSAASGEFGSSATLKAANTNQPSFVVAMSAATGQLQLTGTSGGTTPSSSVELAVAIPAPHLSNPDAGTLPGELTVSPSGAAGYSIALVVPPGSAGMQPSLSLNYSSQGQNGMLGLGWSLGGLSSIHRCGKTIAQDGVNDRISFSNADRLCLDGQRLVRSNGSNPGTEQAALDAAYWDVDAEYRTEIESFSRIRARMINGQRSFRMEAKDGRILTFGSTPTSYVQAIVASHIAAKNGPQSWALDRVIDRAGNFVSMTYAQDPTSGEHHPEVIRYGAAGQPAHAAVKFQYQARPDAWKRYIDETRNDLRTRISHIKSYVGMDLNGDVEASGTLVRDYVLEYSQSPTSGRSMLDAVQGCAVHPDTGQRECLPKTVFTWAKPDPAKQPKFESKGFWAGAPLLTTHGSLGVNHADFFAFADFNRDGLGDALEKRVAIPGSGNTSDNPIAAGTMRTQYRYFHNNGAGFTTFNYQLSSGAAFVVTGVGDFDGDGAGDLVVATANGARICLSPLGAPGRPVAGATIIFRCDPNRPAVGTNSSVDTPYVVDILGDGRAGHYGYLREDGSAPVCIQESCVTDHNPPKAVLRLLGDSSFQRRYSSFEQMVDFAGIGKPYAAQWSELAYLRTYRDAEEPIRWVRTEGTAAVVTLTGFAKPGTLSAAGRMTGFAPPTSKMPCNTNDCQQYHFDAPTNGAGVSGDFNGSGYSGLAFGYTIYQWGRADPVYFPLADFYFCLSTGRALDCGIRKKFSDAQYLPVRAVDQFVGDGQSKILTEETVYTAGFAPQATGNIQMCDVRGDDTTGGTGTGDTNIVCEKWPGVLLPRAVSGLHDEVYFMDLLGTGRTQLVYYHTGKYDANNVWREDGRWEVFAPVDLAVEGQALDRLVSVTNGLGATSTVEFGDAITGGVVEPNSDSPLVYPQQLTRNPGKFVRRLRVSNGTSADTTSRYTYQNAGIDVAGRGALGFAKFTVTDEQSGIVVTTRYQQTWPHTGSVQSVETTSAGGRLLSRTGSSQNQKVIVHPSGAKSVFLYSDLSAVERRDLDGSDLGLTLTLSQYEDGWGNLTGQTISRVATDIFSPMHVTSTSTVFRNDSDNWLLGLPTSKTTTKSDPDGTSVTRKVESDYDVNGKLKTKTVEKGMLQYEITTEYDRTGNAFGLVSKTIDKWYDPASASVKARTSETVYDSRGRFGLVIKNALGHLESHTFQAGTGAHLSTTGPNGLTTKWEYDGFGRLGKEVRADGNESRSYTKMCQGDCPVGTMAYISENFHGAQRISVPTVAYTDHAGHLLRTQTWGADGRVIVNDQRYDSRGRIEEVDHPRYSDKSAYLASRRYYDALSRVIKTVTKDEAGGEQASLMDYRGLVTVMTNPMGNTRTETRNSLGQLLEVRDPMEGLTQFAYDAGGNLNKTIDPNGNVITVEHDRMGRRTDLRDPDLGWIHYEIDPIGQTYSQVTPKQRAAGQQARFTFDLLGRTTARYEADLESHWVFDSAVKGIGRLAEAYTGTANAKDYRRIQTYDALGRPSLATRVLTDGSYTSQFSYDNWGRMSSQTYRRGSDAPKIISLRYGDTGTLNRVERGSLVLWKVTATDAAMRPTKMVLGNGLVQTEVFNDYTGRMESGAVANDAGSLRLSEGYQYDVVGSVTKRTHYWDASGFQEDFTYDKLGRLKTSAMLSQPVQNFDYDAAGNLLSKTGTGTGSGSYVYPLQGAGAVRPHAVTSIPGIGNFDYDANGNLINGAQRTLEWNSFDMPLRITKGGVSAHFTYGPEHQRTRQDRSDGSRVIYAGAQEVESKNGQVTVKTYWPGGIGVEIDRPGAPTQLNWAHVDRLGSVIGLTDANGNLRERLAYDAWGKRRQLADSATPDSLDGQTDNRGFTGHELLDQLDLVHMNGRVFDPQTARFMSADALIQDPASGQSYNRYSYVLNNPTNLTDPSGFCASGVTLTGSSLCYKTGEQAAAAAETLGTKGTGLERTTITKDGELHSSSVSQGGVIIGQVTLGPAANAKGLAPAVTASASASQSAASGAGSPAGAGGSAQASPCAGSSACVQVTGKRESLPAGGNRGFTPGEITFGQQFYPYINYQTPRIYRKKAFAFQPKERAMAPDGNMYFHPDSTRYSDDFSTDTADKQHTFIHELGHIGQTQQGEWVPLAIFDRNYQYLPFQSGKPYTRYGLEARAEMMADYFLLKAHPNWWPTKEKGPAPSLSAYENLLPFIGREGTQE